jgi:hypothetical protein
METLFKKWLKVNTMLSEISCDKYVRAIRAITIDMHNEGVLDYDLYNIKSALAFQKIMKIIYENSYFQDKDLRGNRMYSCAMNHYLEFLLQQSY